MYRVSIELYKHEWKFGRTRNAVGTRAAGECFLSVLEFSQTFTSVCQYNSILKHGIQPPLIRSRYYVRNAIARANERRLYSQASFLFLLENTATRKRKTTC